MKKKNIIFTLGVIVLFFGLGFLTSYMIFQSNNTTIIGTYNSDDGGTVQLSIGEDGYTEYVEQKKVAEGSYENSNGCGYLLTSGSESFFLYQEKDYIYYYNPNIQSSVLKLKKTSDVPRYYE